MKSYSNRVYRLAIQLAPNGLVATACALHKVDEATRRVLCTSSELDPAHACNSLRLSCGRAPRCCTSGATGPGRTHAWFEASDWDMNTQTKFKLTAHGQQEAERWLDRVAFAAEGEGS